MLRILFSSAKTTHKPILFLDSGILSIESKLDQRKLLFLHHLIILPAESLANQVYIEQKNHKFPWLVQECQQLIADYDLPDIISDPSLVTKNHCKKIVKVNIKSMFESDLKKERYLLTLKS